MQRRYYFRLKCLRVKRGTSLFDTRLKRREVTLKSAAVKRCVSHLSEQVASNTAPVVVFSLMLLQVSTVSRVLHHEKHFRLGATLI